jgi:hypothetical protein
VNLHRTGVLMAPRAVKAITVVQEERGAGTKTRSAEAGGSAEPEPEPEPAAENQRAELTLTPGQPPGELGQWIKDLAAAHRTFAEKLADLQSLKIPAEDPRYGDLGQAFPPWPRPATDAILQPPNPEIRPFQQVLEHAADRDADWEAAD